MPSINSILIADDSRADRFLVAEAIKQIGFPFNLYSAENGEQAVSKAKAYRPGLILMDLAMLPKDGLGALKDIKEEFGDEIKIVIMTSGSDVTQVHEARDLGADAFFIKPDGLSETYAEKLVTVLHVFVNERFEFVHFDKKEK